MAKQIIGAEPVTTAWGVVFSIEVFGAPGKAEKFDRHERAKKRGEKLCLRKRFPRIHLPEPENYSADTVDAEDIHFIMEEPKREIDPNFDPDKAIEEMGFAGSEKPEINHDLQIACEQKDSKGRLYTSLPTGELRFHLKGIHEKGQRATEEDGIKAQSIEMIIAARESGTLEEPGAKQPPLVK
jgi:hypothetical protein